MQPTTRRPKLRDYARCYWCSESALLLDRELDRVASVPDMARFDCEKCNRANYVEITRGDKIKGENQ